MRKPSKMVPRTELDDAKSEADRYRIAVDALLSGKASKPYRVAETIHCHGAKGNSYIFRFVERPRSGCDLVIVTFRCESTGQSDSTRAHDVQAQLDLAYAGGIWALIFQTAYAKWKGDKQAAA